MFDDKVCYVTYNPLQCPQTFIYSDYKNTEVGFQKSHEDTNNDRDLSLLNYRSSLLNLLTDST